MPVHRGLLSAPPHCYWVKGRFILKQECFREDGAVMTFLELLEEVRRLFDSRLFAWSLVPTGYQLVIAHRQRLVEEDAVIRERWRSFGGNAVPMDRLRQRLTSLSGLMQVLAQTFSRRHNRLTGCNGSRWQPRYRSCLLADDSALLAAITAVEAETGEILASSAGRRGCVQDHPRLATAPLCKISNGMILPMDRAPTSTPPPAPEDEQVLLDAWLSGGVARDLETYIQILPRSWALGQAESLAEMADRLGRHQGRGRSRRLRELDDEQGLCGLWG